MNSTNSKFVFVRSDALFGKENEIGHNSEVDFRPVSTEEHDDRMAAAISNIANLRNFVRPKLDRKKPGCRATVVRMMFYLLPGGSELPRFTKKDPLIQTHQNHGFGIYVS